MISKIMAPSNWSFALKSKVPQKNTLLKRSNELFNSKIMNAKKEIILYIIFGIFTTLVNIISYLFFAHIIGIYDLFSNIMAWFFSIIFAYITNRIYVFESKNENVLYEFALFVTGRGLSGILDSLLFFMFVIWLMFDDVISKIVINIIVVILNYVLSKKIIFKER